VALFTGQLLVARPPLPLHGLNRWEKDGEKGSLFTPVMFHHGFLGLALLGYWLHFLFG